MNGVLSPAFHFVLEFCVFCEPSSGVVLGADDVVVSDVELECVFVVESQ